MGPQTTGGPEAIELQPRFLRNQAGEHHLALPAGGTPALPCRHDPFAPVELNVHMHTIRGSAVPGRHARTLPALVASALLALGGVALAAPASLCRPWREERDTLAQQAMAAEIALVQQTRQRLCPQLERQASAANADQRDYGPIDYQALIDCRQRAEQSLRRSRTVLYRNDRGFLFYTAEGARLARRADAVHLAGRMRGCP